ncbi:MAG TPA: inorganic diphosphatase [Phenylobacterium sp.]|jgi:inorganic pyrophosphatase
MADLAALDACLDDEARTCRAVVECPRGGRIKYAYDRRAQAFEMKRILPDGMAFPLDFGFVPSTRAQDGDPLDILILNDEPAEVGALLGVRLIAVIEAEQSEESETFRNDRILAVAEVSHLFEALKGPGDLPERFLKNLTQFWVNYGALRGATFKVLGLKGPAEAVRVVRGSLANQANA